MQALSPRRRGTARGGSLSPGLNIRSSGCLLGSPSRAAPTEGSLLLTGGGTTREGLKAPASLAVRVAFLVSSHLVPWMFGGQTPSLTPRACGAPTVDGLGSILHFDQTLAGLLQVLASWRC